MYMYKRAPSEFSVIFTEMDLIQLIRYTVNTGLTLSVPPQHITHKHILLYVKNTHIYVSYDFTPT